MSWDTEIKDDKYIKLKKYFFENIKGECIIFINVHHFEGSRGNAFRVKSSQSQTLQNFIRTCEACETVLLIELKFSVTIIQNVKDYRKMCRAKKLKKIEEETLYQLEQYQMPTEGLKGL